MAAIKNPASATHSVRGRIFNASSKDGVGGLVITVYDIPKSRTPTRRVERARQAGLDSWRKNAVRLGSVLSDKSGAFVLDFEHETFSARNERRRPDLLLVVAAPDRENAAAENVLYFTDPPRRNAGRVETFNIGIASDTLNRFGLSDQLNVNERISEYRRGWNADQQLSQSIAEFHKASIKEDAKEREKIRKELLQTVVTDARVVSLPGEVVLGTDGIKKKLDRVAAKGVAQANSRILGGRGVPVNLFLTPADRKRLQPYFKKAVNGFATIPEHELQDILFRRQSTDNPGTLLVHRNPIAKFCAEQTFEQKCAKDHTGLAPQHEHPDGTGSNGTDGAGSAGTRVRPLTNADIPKYAAKLLDSAPSPDLVLSPEFNNQRVDKNGVEAAVDAFSLRAPPADAPATYDVQTLQVAFDHVWKVLVDEEMVNAAHTLNKTYKIKTGLDLADRFSPQWPFQVLDNPEVYDSIPREVPAEVLAQFDITLEEWIDLSASLQTKLLEIARDLAASLEFPASRIGALGHERKRQDLREQGERIIDSVRHDDYYTLHKTLRDLHERMNGTYEFTVFAADKTFHAVNFGLLVTYRQQWTPINYQAGKLVKTVPLSPKEERKYSLKTTRNMKHVQKEAAKNNSSLTGEQTSTSRVEAEIMQKALGKTNFNLSTNGSYNIGISKGTATTSFGTEAQQESSSNRKDFREAVLKAVQEYKDERSLEVVTEETTDAEYTESGTIVNPNDELSVTYLFYELQRRYRVSEQLYRVQPVVLVAQEVPAPHQITEAWVISHAWIINRFLLDDGFRGPLDFLSNRSVGDDFALRELRKNLRQQRNLVETLRIELTIASNEAENRYRALEASIERRIEEERAEDTDGWFSDVKQFFGGEGQDPEAAKARELAAKDAHQYAVEKAEKAAAALRQEVNNLHALTTEYNKALRNHLDNETRVKRLLVHIRNNIFYYMQAIWSMEPPDQRFLRLHKVQVPQVELARIPDPDNDGATVPDRRFAVEVEASEDIFATFREPDTTKHRAFMTGRIQKGTGYRPLVEVADLDSLLGFKGNYAMFALKAHNAVTGFMAGPYIDAAFGAMDPDELSNVSLEDYSKYICCLHDRLPAAKFNELKPELKKWLEQLEADSHLNGTQVVVPTGSLLVENLPGAHPLLENFKLRHRELDVYKVQEEVRKASLEALRLAARLINDERGDPNVEKKVVVAGRVQPNISVDE